MNKTILLIIITTLISGISGGTSIAQNQDPDHRLLKRDLLIMEGVLDKLMNGVEKGEGPLPGNTKGFYLQNYGILFLTSLSPRGQFIFNIIPDKDDQIHKLRQRIIGLQNVAEKSGRYKKTEIIRADTAKHSLNKSVAENEVDRSIIVHVSGTDGNLSDAERTDRAREAMERFFLQYAAAIGQLNPEEKIGLIIETDAYNAKTNDRFLSGWVRFGNLEDFRKNKISKRKIIPLLHIEPVAADSAITEDIDIFTEIIGKAISLDTRFNSASTSGVYLKSLGAIVNISLSSFGWIANNMYIQIAGNDALNKALIYSTSGGKQDTLITDEKLDPSKKSAVINKLRNECLDLLAHYGHTTRIPQDEYMVLVVDLGSGFTWHSYNGDDENYFVIQAKKADLDLYHSGDITLKNLKERLLSTSY